MARDMTTVGLIGSGNVGGTVARLAVAAGYDVVLSNSRGPDTLKELVELLGEKHEGIVVFRRQRRGGRLAQFIGPLAIIFRVFGNRHHVFLLRAALGTRGCERTQSSMQPTPGYASGPTPVVPLGTLAYR